MEIPDAIIIVSIGLAVGFIAGMMAIYRPEKTKANDFLRDKQVVSAETLAPIFPSNQSSVYAVLKKDDYNEEGHHYVIKDFPGHAVGAKRNYLDTGIEISFYHQHTNLHTPGIRYEQLVTAILHSLEKKRERMQLYPEEEEMMLGLQHFLNSAKLVDKRKRLS